MKLVELKNSNLGFMGIGLRYKIVKRLLSPYGKYKEFLAESQWWSKEKLEAFQLQKLQKVVETAYKYTPYYRATMEIFDVTPDDINSLDDISRMPILEKEDVRCNSDKMISDTAIKALHYEAHTSGSTGKPLRLYRNLDNIGFEHAMLMRQWQWAGLEHNDRYACIKGDIMSSSKIRNNEFWAYSPLDNRLYMSSYHIKDENLKYYLAALKKYKVVGVEGYPSSLFALAKYMLAKNERFTVRAVLTTSETLLPFQKEVIMDAFQCKVFDYYGMAERIAAIHTCDHGNYHLVPEYSLVEYIQGDGLRKGNYELIGTSLSNLSMPLIRYRVGDVIRPGNKSCTCGRAYPVIDTIAGRTDDYVVTPSGKLIGRLDHIFKGISNVIEAQVYQPDIKNLILRIVPDANFTNKDTEQILNKLQLRVGEKMDFSVEQVDSIKRGRTGKLKSVLSEVSAF